MTLQTAFASSTLAIAFLLAACAGPEEDGAETSSREQAAARAPVPPPPPPPDPAVDWKCVSDAREAYHQCVRANPDQQRACSDRHEAAHRACRGVPPAPPPPPGPRDPKCVSDAREAYAQCVRANPDQQQACSDRHKAAYEACPPATTPPPAPPPPAVPGGR
jgi:hypothetical protein